MKCKTKDLSPTIVKVDVLVYCYYCLFIRKKYRKSDRVRVQNLVDALAQYDSYYLDIDTKKIKKEIIRLFPLRKNNHKNTKILKINKDLVNYWGVKFNICYELHNESYRTYEINNDK